MSSLDHAFMTKLENETKSLCVRACACVGACALLCSFDHGVLLVEHNDVWSSSLHNHVLTQLPSSVRPATGGMTSQLATQHTPAYTRLRTRGCVHVCAEILQCDVKLGGAHSSTVHTGTPS
eukprot:9849884-Prorocentrum_lima.AAC.1